MQLKSDSNRISGMYRGKVIDTADPKQVGRVRVQIYGYFDDITDTDNIPWAVPILPIFSGAGTGHGWFAVPAVGSEVMCFFEAGDIYQPVYFGEAPTGVHGHPSDLTTNYPNRRGLKTPSGHMIFIDDTTNEIEIKHSGGAYINIKSALLKLFMGSAKIQIDNSGNITIEGTRVDINP